MACPFFYPTTQADHTAFLVRPRLPLGHAYAGECHAAALPVSPSETILLSSCNNGYGRGSCDRFPPESKIDAVRFHIGFENQEPLAVQFVYERDCWPAGHGLLRYSKSLRRFMQTPGDPILQRQAEAFLESFLARD